MERAIECLMKEHRVIEGVLGALETFTAAAAKGETVKRETVRDFGEFFRNFADRCHHGKEEDLLFATMVQHGFPGEFGPIAVMLAEHVDGREHVGALVSIGAGRGPLADEEHAQLIRHASAYVPLLRAHILKEDNILYPMALRALPQEVMVKLARDFETVEHDVIGDGAHEAFHRLAETLARAYPADPVKAASAAACVGCHGQV